MQVRHFSERVAGRLFTYNFDYQINKDGTINRNYYDVGTMGLCNNLVMQRYVCSFLVAASCFGLALLLRRTLPISAQS